MQQLVQDAWALKAPAWAQHVGDLSWRRFEHVGREPEWRTRLWEENERVIAYAWLFEGGVLDFRRRGLASTVCAFALRRLEEEGATRAIVYGRGDAEYAAPKALYESLGFAQHARTVDFRKPKRGS